MTERYDDVSVVNLAGDIDSENGKELIDRIWVLIRSQWKKIVLDLKDVDHIHYKVFSDLMVLDHMTTFVAGGIKLANVTPYAREILRVAGVDGQLETYDSVAEAVLSFERGADTRFEFH